LGRTNFDPHKLSAGGSAETTHDWFDLGARLRDLARLASQAAASGLAVDPAPAKSVSRDLLALRAAIPTGKNPKSSIHREA